MYRVSNGAETFLFMPRTGFCCVELIQDIALAERVYDQRLSIWVQIISMLGHVRLHSLTVAVDHFGTTNV